jgi:hypothetical protein
MAAGSGAKNGRPLGLPVGDAVLHHEHDVLQNRNIFHRIPADRNDVREQPDGDAAAVATRKTAVNRRDRNM